MAGGQLWSGITAQRYEANKLPERAVQKGEARIWHILKKHRLGVVSLYARHVRVHE